MAKPIYKLDILAKEINENLPYWLDPSQKQDKDHPSRQAIRDRHRTRWLAEQDAKREEKELADIIREADELGLRLSDHPTAADIEEAKRFLGIKEFDESKHPRGEGGKWTESGGEGGAGEGVSEEGVDKYGMSAKDRAQVYDWMGSGYRHLRTDESFRKVLEKLPEYSGRVYRGTRVDVEQLSKLKIGSTYRIEKFSSSSMRQSVAEEFTTSSRHEVPTKIEPVVFEINDTGRRIPRPLAELAGSDFEAEVILMRGDRYKITEVTKETDDEDRPYTRVSMSHVRG